MRKSSKVVLLAGSILSAAVSTSAQQAAAQSDTQQGSYLEEIVVSARRRTESLQNVPVAVAPISKSELQNNAVTSFANLAELAPQVLIGATATGTGALLSIRGISSGATDSGIDQSVSVDIDGVQLNRGRIISHAIFDLQQVEVLEGPQALFFGKNSPAGVISLHSTDPGSKFEAGIKAGYEFEAKERYGEGFISGPVTDTLKARLAVRGSYMDGWIKDIAQPIADPLVPGAFTPGASSQRTSPRGHDIAGRLTLVWEPTDDFDAKLKVTADDQRINGQLANAEPFCVGGQTTPVELGFLVGNPVDCVKNMTKDVNSFSPQLAINLPYGNGGTPYAVSHDILSSLVLNKKFQDVTLTSTTGFYAQSISDSGVDDESHFAQVYDAEHERYHLFTQELRANTAFDFPVNFTGGAYYEHSNRPFFNTPILFPGIEGFDPVARNYSNNEMQSKETGTVYSFFGQARWTIIPTVELAGGVRYTHDAKNLSVENLTVNPGSAGLGINLYPAGQVINSHYRGRNWSPEATLTWHPEPDQTLYVGYKTGYKPGGISNGALLYSYATAANLQYGHESTKGEEVGYKADLFSRSLRVDVTAYTYKYNGLQVASVNNVNGATVFTVSNAASATTKGIEASAQWLATDELTFKGNVGYNRARYKKFPGAACYEGQTAAQGCVGNLQDLSGRALVRAPDVTFDLGADYKVEFIHGWTTDFATDAAFTSSYQTAGDSNPGAIQPHFWRVNAAVHFISDNSHYQFSVIGRNLTNSYYLVSANGQDAGAVTQFDGFFNRPREVLLEAQYTF